MLAKMRKFLCFVLVCAMLLTSVPVQAMNIQEEPPVDFGIESVSLVPEQEMGAEAEPPPPAFGREPAAPEIDGYLHNNEDRLSSDSLVENLLDAIVEEVFDGEPFFYLEPCEGV